MNVSASIRKLAQLFIVLFIALSGGLVYWQVVVAQQVTSNIHNSRHCLPDNAPIRYDNYLSGRIGLTALNNTVNQTLHRPPVGDDIYLTIDVRMQRLVDYYFDAAAVAPDGHNVFQTNRGSVIVSDPHTGEILAMLSRPTFDSNRIASGDLNYFKSLEQDPEHPLLERPIQATYIPGSTYKTMTLMAALDSGSAHLSDPFYNDTHGQAVRFDPNHPQAIGPVIIGSGDQTEVFGLNGVGNNIEPYTTNFPISLTYGYVHSDNIIFAQVGAKTGVNTWLDYNKRFYVGQQIPFDLPVTPSTVTPKDGKPLGVNQLAENSFGQGIDSITPMQMSLIDNTIANNGQMMRPSLVMKIVDPNGSTVLSSTQQALGTPISDTTAREVRDGMYGVVQCGSGRFGPPPPELNTSPYAIIAKTGTGQVGGGQPAEAWLITQAPYQNPQLTIVALKENAGEGGSAVGPMVTDIYNDIFSKVTKIPTAPAVDPNFCLKTGYLQS